MGTSKFSRKRVVISCLSALLVTLGVFVSHLLRNSSQFIIKNIVVESDLDGSPVSATDVIQLADVKVGTTNLFSLFPDRIADKVKANEWIKGATVTKEFPSTLRIQLELRVPVAMAVNASGVLTYVDSSGAFFLKANPALNFDLPLLTGMDSLPEYKRVEAVNVLALWKKARLEEVSQVTEVHYNPESGYDLLVIYPSKQNLARTFVQFGQDFDIDSENQFSKLRSVFKYLIEKDLTASRILAENEKKIVVKIAHGS